MKTENQEPPIGEARKEESRATIEVTYEPENLSESESIRVEQLRKSIDEYYEKIPHVLRDLPDAQEKCLELLSLAEKQLTPPIGRRNIIDARLALVKLEIEIRRSQSSKMSFVVVAAIVYVFALAVGALIGVDAINVGVEAKELNSTLVMGIPLPIWIWGVIGSLTSMLLRAGHFPFSDRSEAYRWLLFRPIVGVVMGVLTYLMVTAGLIVFAGTANTQTPELLWVIAFVGSFSDNLSINLLQKILGKFEVEQEKPENQVAADEKVKSKPQSAREVIVHSDRHSVVAGWDNVSAGGASIAVGEDNIPGSISSVTGTTGSVAYRQGAVLGGYQNKANKYASTVIGGSD